MRKESMVCIHFFGTDAWCIKAPLSAVVIEPVPRVAVRLVCICSGVRPSPHRPRDPRCHNTWSPIEYSMCPFSPRPVSWACCRRVAVPFSPAFALADTCCARIVAWASCFSPSSKSAQKEYQSWPPPNLYVFTSKRWCCRGDRAKLERAPIGPWWAILIYLIRRGSTR